MLIPSVLVHQQTSSMRIEAEETIEEEEAGIEVVEAAEAVTTITIVTRMEAKAEVAITIPQEMEVATITRTSSIEEEEEATVKAMATKTMMQEKEANQLGKEEAEAASNLEVATMGTEAALEAEASQISMKNFDYCTSLKYYSTNILNQNA